MLKYDCDNNRIIIYRDEETIQNAVNKEKKFGKPINSYYFCSGIKFQKYENFNSLEELRNRV